MLLGGFQTRGAVRRRLTLPPLPLTGPRSCMPRRADSLFILPGGEHHPRGGGLVCDEVGPPREDAALGGAGGGGAQALQVFDPTAGVHA